MRNTPVNPVDIFLREQLYQISTKNKPYVISVNIMPFYVFSVKATDPLISDAAGPALLVTSIGAGPKGRQC